MASTTMLLRALASRVCLGDAGSSSSGRAGAPRPLSPGSVPRAPRRLVPATLSRPRRAPASPPRAVGDDVAMRLFSAAQSADDLVGGQLSGGVTPATFAVVLAAGLVTSLSPCTLSVPPPHRGLHRRPRRPAPAPAPEDPDETDDQRARREEVEADARRAALAGNALAFAAGLATTLPPPPPPPPPPRRHRGVFRPSLRPDPWRRSPPRRLRPRRRHGPESPEVILVEFPVFSAISTRANSRSRPP